MSVLADSAASKTPMGPKGVPLPKARSVRYNPGAAELQELTSRMSQARRTSFGNYNVQTVVTSRSTASTYLVTDEPGITTGQAISTDEGQRVAKVQADYIAELLTIFAAEQIHGAFIYTFTEEAPHSPDPRYDYDMASYGIVKIYEDGSDKSYSISGYWEPKLAFHEIARIYGGD